MLSGSFSQRAYGALLLVFGTIAIIAPFSAGGWAISILGLIVLIAGAAGVVQGVRTQSPFSTSTTYLPVRPCHPKNMIGGFLPAATGHVLEHNRGISRNVLLQVRNEGFDAYIARTAGIAAHDDDDRLALIKRNLSVGTIGDRD
jgi:hypothetical protein